MSFQLDHRLQQDGILLGESEHYVLNLVNDCRYIWLVLIPKVFNAKNTFDLSERQQVDMALLCNRIGEFILNEFAGDKFNIASLGNLVPQLHVHLIVRCKNDAAWPDPIWGVGQAVPYDDQQLASVVKRLQPVVDKM